jgi:DNA modification methylase
MNEYQLYRGDCLEIMPTMLDNSVDLVLVDPPYPDLKGGTKHINGGVSGVLNQVFSVGDEWAADLKWVEDACRIARLGVICFCSYHSVGAFQSALTDCGLIPRGLGTWYKRNSPNPVNNVPKFTTEFYWMFQKSPGLQWRNVETMIDEPMPVAGCFATERLLKPGSKVALHPTQKPLRLMREILRIDPDSVLDCFMGTGTAGEAAVRLGMKFVGIEQNITYFTVAERRIADAARQVRGEFRTYTDTATHDDLPLFAVAD